MNGITGIDHPVIAVRDMQAARRAYERLGFTIPPRGSHLEWGTGNWCIMFQRDYLELRGIIDPAKYTHGLDQFLKGREGLMGVAFGTRDAEASYRDLAARGLRPNPVRPLTRNFDLPEGAVQPRFALCFLDAVETPGLMSVVLCQHLTPELLRRPEWLVHANGAEEVCSLTAVVADPSAVVDPYRKLFGAAVVSRAGDRIEVRLAGGQSIRVVDAAGARRLHPGVALPGLDSLPCLVAVALRVQSLATTAALFALRQIEFVRGAAGSLRVPAIEACGVVIEFSEHDVSLEGKQGAGPGVAPAL